MSPEEIITKNLDEQIKTINELKNNKKTIQEIYMKIKEVQNKGNKIFVMGNGGSSSTSSHFVSDLLKTSLTIESKKPKHINEAFACMYLAIPNMNAVYSGRFSS